ncbi:MAG: leucine-rich repeat protein [Muribaculaceae bacterium]|nr:leucine-rich repeat protein [Muribaculaceae bacterium]
MSSKNIIKRTFALMMVAFPFIHANGAVDFVVDGISYTKLTGATNSVEVSKPATGYYTESSIVIPSKVEYDGIEYAVTGIGKNAFFSSRNMTSLVIPEGITYIESSGLYNTGLTEIVIPSTVSTLADHAVYSNEFLKKVVINADLTEFPDYCFDSCKKLVEINIPGTVERIGKYALAQSGLREVTLPEALRDIDNNAFQNSPSLKKVNFNEGLEYIGERAFFNCTALEEVIIPGTVKKWGGGTRYTQSPFRDCNHIKRLVFNEGVTEIPASCITMMNGVNALEEIIIPASVTKIGEEAFYNNTPWRQGGKIAFYGSTPLDYEDDKFGSATLLKNCTIEVPEGCSDAYRAHPVWGKFENIVERADKIEVPEFFKNTIGTGKAYAGLSIWWGDDIALDNLTEAVLFNSNSTVEDIILSALENDPRFYALKDTKNNLIGFGFDTNGDNSAAVKVDSTPLSLIAGVATVEGDFQTATGSSDYDHWKVNSDEMLWKVFVNGNEADWITEVSSGDHVTLEYTLKEATEPSDKDYTFYLRPADELGIWSLEEIQLNTATDKNGNSVYRFIPMIANICDQTPYLYGAKISAEVRSLDNETSSSDYGAYIPDAAKGAMLLRVTASKPVQALILPYLNIRKDWGSGSQEVRRIYTDTPVQVSTFVANPVTGISLKEFEVGETIVMENMGCTLITPQYEPEDADFQNYAVSFGDESIVTIYSSIKGLVAHRAGETTMTVTVPGTDIKAEYIVKVKGVDPEDKPQDDFADGLFYLNEEWFTHTSGSINYITEEGDVYYRVYGNQNENKAFGATSQFATIYADKLIVMSKQAWDNGDTREKSGGRVVVADANTLKYIGSIDEIGGDGRACVGVNPNKVYLSHTKGIRVLNMDEDGITVENSDIQGIDTGRNGQMGDMVKAGKYVFAVCVGNTVYVIDTATDELVKTIPVNGVQTVAQSLDGRVWIGCAKTLQSIDPETLELGEVKTIGIGQIGCSSGSWRPGNLRSSNKTNTLFWSTGNWNGSTGDLVRWDIDENDDPSTAEMLYKHGSVPEETYSMGYGTPNYDSRSDMWIYSSVPGFGAASMNNRLHFVDASTGELKHTIELNPYFWFPSIALVPDKYFPEILLDDIELPTLAQCDEKYEYDLNEFLDDKDNANCNISVSMFESSMLDELENNNQAAEISLDGKKLIVKPLSHGSHTFTLLAESNGKITSKNIEVKVGHIPVGISTTESVSGTIMCNGSFLAFRDLRDVTFDVFSINGSRIDSFTISDDTEVKYPSYGSGYYILRGSNGMTTKIHIN